MPSSAVHWRVPLADVRLPEEAVSAAQDVLRGGWLSSGPHVERFEVAFAEWLGVPHAVACASGTAALQLAFAAADIGAGHEVVMPSLSFVAAANVARLAGATPVFADVKGEEDLTLDPESVQRALSPRTRALVAMHYGGHPCDPALVELAREYNLTLIEDAAHAPGASGPLGRCGTWGAAGCFSFFANKNLPLGEGGMLVTARDEVAERARQLRSHGMTSGTWDRQAGGPASYDVTSPGFNLRLDEMRAAIGVVLLTTLDAENERRAGAVARYRRRLEGSDRLAMPFGDRPGDERSAHHLAVVVLAPGADRDAVARELEMQGIQTSVHYRPIHQLTAHRGARAHAERTEALAPRLLTLPLFPDIEESQIDYVCDALTGALRA